MNHTVLQLSEISDWRQRLPPVVRLPTAAFVVSEESRTGTEFTPKSLLLEANWASSRGRGLWKHMEISHPASDVRHLASKIVVRKPQDSGTLMG